MTISECCVPAAIGTTITACHACGQGSKAVKLVTLKALLTPAALATLEPGEAYRFCPGASCDVTYFSPSRTYGQREVKVPVFQKNLDGNVPVCSCFGHTRADLERATRDGHADAIPQSIQGHIQAGRCGCELNNPQGSCCLGNVNRTLVTLREARVFRLGAPR